MFPGEFEYHAPETIEEALDLLSRHGSNARLLAGGHSLIPMMKLRLSSSQHLVDLKKLKSSLSYIREENGDLAIGALTTHSEVEFSDSLRQKAAPLAEAAGLIGDVQVRNMGTLGGSLAHADPAADQPAPALALEAQLVAQGPGGRRTISADQFFFGFFSTALQQDELLVEVRVAGLGANSGGAYLKCPHPASGYAVCGVAAVVETDGGGNCVKCRVGVTGISDGAYRATGVESALEGSAISADAIAAASAHASDGVEPLEDYFAGADYRRALAAAYVRRALTTASERAAG
jgi:carbon-monoxide dehydrogenase medium subunit